MISDQNRQLLQVDVSGQPFLGVLPSIRFVVGAIFLVLVCGDSLGV